MEPILLPYNNIFGFKFAKIISGRNALAKVYIYIYTSKVDYLCVIKLSVVQRLDINIYFSSFASSFLLYQILCILPNHPELDSERTALVNVSGVMFGGVGVIICQLGGWFCCYNKAS